jgi:hypothetical protein
VSRNKAVAHPGTPRSPEIIRDLRLPPLFLRANETREHCRDCGHRMARLESAGLAPIRDGRHRAPRDGKRRQLASNTWRRIAACAPMSTGALALSLLRASGSPARRG